MQECTFKPNIEKYERNGKKSELDKLNEAMHNHVKSNKWDQLF